MGEEDGATFSKVRLSPMRSTRRSSVGGDGPLSTGAVEDKERASWMELQGCGVLARGCSGVGAWPGWTAAYRRAALSAARLRWLKTLGCREYPLAKGCVSWAFAAANEALHAGGAMHASRWKATPWLDRPSQGLHCTATDV